jgi:NADPH:quinone reductase-like Zn-dependent oxidoreductase
MKAAVVFDLQQGPVWADFTDPQADARHALVKVNAAAISHVVKGRASGKHYSFDGRLPFVVGIDGAGTLAGGQRVYFAFPMAPWGSMAQWAPVAVENCLPLPDGLDDITAAAMANPGMSAWAALVKRAGLAAGERADQRRNRQRRSASGTDCPFPRRKEDRCHRSKYADTDRPRRRRLYRLNGR